jgi:hypothetical protein
MELVLGDFRTPTSDVDKPPEVGEFGKEGSWDGGYPWCEVVPCEIVDDA